eukprot:TRINITY_DN1848_c1_g1_i3.p1 TRINITY_DN1848_c1_g1~~TRINITY_DN1848_c1_g1_i3.p1  ORF type:complete len:330 (+),score=52.44 TRINITY_DN1848_c1_g1_i3:71-991(+)
MFAQEYGGHDDDDDDEHSWMFDDNPSHDHYDAPKVLSLPLNDAVRRLRANDRLLFALEIYTIFRVPTDKGVGQLAKALQRNTVLRSLTIRFPSISREGAGRLADALRLNTTLTKLDLSSNDIDSIGAGRFADALKVNTSLKELNLSNNLIRDEGAGWLADALRVNTTLEKLDLSWNKLKDKGVKQFSSALRANSTLKEISLYNNKVSLDRLVEIRRTNSTLMEISLHNNKVSLDRLEEIRRTAEDRKRAALKRAEHRKLVFVWCAQIGTALPMEVIATILRQSEWDLCESDYWDDQLHARRKCTVS